ncbi:MAG: bifunctional phosphopantothenoylcysteine decarboxylase/phosphopantothenate--cysteine ligase CoaBC [Bacteroidia bacterium]|nr:bifunctional phosphopantothenoylcysteine decarboxylase/phosphopantothenate--cysteine ligase CoaBC [Bacteroidia bacterium]NNM15264.1 bifunctional phosphopantothenoylcysteine decarboxylase/phosphopantothenate--cysteine ligase CoaBC [Bacteroidia bacterium]
MLPGGKKIILGVCGSIAAYKSAELVRLLVKSGAEVKVIMTEAAKDFITPLTLSTLSKHEVLSDFSNTDTDTWNEHVQLGLWADHLLIAPASANTIAKMAHGMCDNFLTAVYLSAKCSVSVAPAMDLDMYQHPSTQQNLSALQSYGVSIIGPDSGELASGLNGMGRMTEPEEIVQSLSGKKKDQSLVGYKALVTAGPTREAIDPVRFLSNNSSGKMGVAIANELANRGADVTLVAGPGCVNGQHNSINRINIVSAAEMHKVCVEHFPNSNITVMAAAVADFTPQTVVDKKIKKNGSELDLHLTSTKDILADIGSRKRENQVVVGFAMETDNALENAKKKLQNKNADAIVLNSLNEKGAGFKTDTNKVTIIDRKGNEVEHPLKLKTEVAQDIIDHILNLL